MPTALEAGQRYIDGLMAIHAYSGLAEGLQYLKAISPLGDHTFINSRNGIEYAERRVQGLLKPVTPEKKYVSGTLGIPVGECKLIAVRERVRIVKAGDAACRLVLASANDYTVTMFAGLAESATNDQPDRFAPGEQLFKLDGLVTLYGPELNIQNVLGVLALFDETQD